MQMLHHAKKLEIKKAYPSRFEAYNKLSSRTLELKLREQRNKKNAP